MQPQRLNPLQASEQTCEVCSAPVHAMPFKGLHILCPKCSEEMNKELRPWIDKWIQDFRQLHLTRQQRED